MCVCVCVFVRVRVCVSECVPRQLVGEEEGEAHVLLSVLERECRRVLPLLRICTYIHTYIQIIYKHTYIHI